MGQDKRSGAQKLFSGLVSPATAASMEAESRTWMIRCTYCGYERSVWDTGGVKYKAAGSSRQLRRCPQCGRTSWHQVFRRQQEGQAGATPAMLPLAHSARRPLLWLLGLSGLAAVVIVFVALLFLLTTRLTQPVVDAGDAFMTALQSGNFAAGYALCTPDLQNKLGDASALATLIQPHQPVRWNWTSRSIRNGVGRLDGDFSYADGGAGAVHLVFREVGNDWKIDSFTLDPTG